MARLPAHYIQNEIMFAVQSEEKSFLQNSRTFEKCMSWPGSRRKKDDTLLSVTVPALCQEQMLLSAGIVARPVASQTLLDDGITQFTDQHEPGRPSEYAKCTEPLLMASEFPVKIADASTAKRYK